MGRLVRLLFDFVSLHFSGLAGNKPVPWGLSCVGAVRQVVSPFIMMSRLVAWNNNRGCDMCTGAAHASKGFSLQRNIMTIDADQFFVAKARCCCCK